VTWDQQADGYRLPTEAEWEFAARGGRDGINQLPLGRVATVGQLCAHGNTEDVQYDTVWGGREGRCDDGYAGLAPVGSFPPNAYGVHDLMGNAPELVWDAWSFGQYDPGVDPGGQFGAASHVLKGGSFTQDLQVAFRLWQDADDRERIQGLRLARGTRPVRELGDVGSDDLLEVVRAEPGTLEENTVTRALAVMPGLVTRGLYREIMGSAPTTGPDDAPVTEVTVVDAARFAEALNARDGLQRTYWVEERNVAFHPGTTGWRLPTEAEWAWVTREGGPVPASGECEWVNDGSGPPATGVDPFGYQGGHLCRKTGAPRGSRYGDGAFRLVRTLP
jgi:formylglycine-generating enzyme required for sulfatase activity